MEKIFEKIQNDEIKQSFNEVFTMPEEKQKVQGKAAGKSLNKEQFRNLSEICTNQLGVKKMGWDFSREKAMAVFAEGDGLSLRPCKAEDARFYNKVHRQWSPFGRNYPPEDSMLPSIRHELTNENTFFCIVQRQSDGTELGYVALKDTTRAIWEVAMEFDRQFCYQGYGGQALGLFWRQIRLVTGRTQFQALVEVENTACQRCLEKLDAEFVGLYNYAFEDEAAAEEFESENLSLINDQMYALAERLGVAPQKLLSHVLDYRFTV